MSFRDYETLGLIGDQLQHARPCVLETYAGADIVAWWGTILNQLENMKTRSEEGGNDEYVTLLGRFLRTWNENELTGSVNAEDVKALKTAAEWAGTLPWNFSNYFRSLTNWLRKLQASLEQLPMTATPERDTGGGGGMPAGTSTFDAEKEPAASQFGPEENAGDLTASPEDQLKKKGPEDIATELSNDLNSAVNSRK